jgi:hypothetical protein
MMWVVGNILTDGNKRAPACNSITPFKLETKALDFAVKLAMDQQDQEDEATVRNELIEDGDYADPNGNFCVFVADLTQNNS